MKALDREDGSFEDRCKPDRFSDSFRVREDSTDFESAFQELHRRLVFRFQRPCVRQVRTCEEYCLSAKSPSAAAGQGTRSHPSSASRRVWVAVLSEAFAASRPLRSSHRIYSSSAGTRRCCKEQRPKASLRWSSCSCRRCVRHRSDTRWFRNSAGRLANLQDLRSG